MTGRLAALLREIIAPSAEGVFNVRRLSDGPAYYAGRDSRDFAAVLIGSSDAGRTVPLRLSGLEATFSTSYQIVEAGKPPEMQTLTAIICTSRASDVVAYFANIMESLLPLLGPNPSTEKVAETVRQLVDIFQKLRAPARRSMVGLLGELCVIEAARDAAVAIGSWRSDPDERFDFAAGKVRLDVKASSNRQRVHEISFEQANPPDETAGLIASIWIEPAGGGMSLFDLLGQIERRIAGQSNEVLRLRSIVAGTLGDTLPQAMAWCFDKQLAESSLRYFDVANIPAIRPPLPPNVSSARFVSDLSGCDPLNVGDFTESLVSAERGLLPTA
ncbi:PD-(D/E)XK motif protein [Bradyrhizobium sp. RP6]|uniref:PD-(D/E)XK motif protein n=1 Tax=Bradyrhizobium sp. RP6 TaxID=2489596 RepID=UPI000F53E98E|nr:PD-(D/E)XK motif protein [Bradyrhizobium sp. RP6]RQH09484.1 PD-(D/E)XK motif protein [Bradyrhizobium sp. RP6]